MVGLFLLIAVPSLADEPPRGADPYADVPAQNPMRPQGEAIDEEREPPPGVPKAGQEASPLRVAGRVLFFPAHLVLEYGLRRPLGFAASSTEGLIRAQLASDESQRARLTVWPVLRLRSDRDALVGAYVGARDPRIRGLRVEAAAGSDFHENVESRARVSWSPRPWLTASLRGAWDARDDVPFHGLGPDSPDDYSAFEHRLVRGALGLRVGPSSTGLSGRVGVGFADHELGCSPDESPAACGDDDRFLPEGQPVAGFDDYRLLEPTLEVAYDSRGRPYASGAAARLRGRLGEVVGGQGSSFTGYEAAGLLALELFRERVLALSLHYAAVDAGDGEVPLTELPRLGGGRLLAGFHEGRFRGRSTLAAQIDYTYPIWSFLRGHLFAGVGDAFGGELSGLEAGELHGSAGLGVEANDVAGIPFRSLVAVGTEPLEDGVEIEGVRLVFELGWGS